MEIQVESHVLIFFAGASNGLPCRWPTFAGGMVKRKKRGASTRRQKLCPAAHRSPLHVTTSYNIEYCSIQNHFDHFWSTPCICLHAGACCNMTPRHSLSTSCSVMLPDKSESNARHAPATSPMKPVARAKSLDQQKYACNVDTNQCQYVV